MSTSFQNPRNPLAAMWASATEKYLREQHPDLNIAEIRRLPFMQGVYEHLSQLRQKQRVRQPPAPTAAKEPEQALRIAQAAYLSQSFFDLAVTTAAFSINVDDELYKVYTAVLNAFHDLDGTTNYSTDDWCGFALCVIVWLGMSGGTLNLGYYEKSLLDFLISKSGLSPEDKQQIRDFWDTTPLSGCTVQYRDANSSAYKDYRAIPWKIPRDAQIVMLGDWGTSMDDAREFLKAIWKQAYLNNPGSTIVFIHLGDIYYCGIPYECQTNFLEVFVRVGQELQNDPSIDNSRFNASPPIFTIPGNHEYYSYGYGYFELLDELNHNQQCSFFCLRTEDDKWQFLGMDTGQADGNALLSLMQAAGGIAKECKEWLDNELPNWSWLHWITNLAMTTYEDFAGPFQPTLRDSELGWLKDRLDEFGGKTIMLSHHQLFSREAEVNHKSPQYLNTWLDNNFSPYYTNKIAAWYWGHEHTFAVYMDGLMGLNKGRLLGSSSYEATEGSDSPYKNNYPMVPFASNMTDSLIHQTNGLYYHAGAIMSQDGSGMDVKYYQFPAWSQLDAPPPNPQLEEIFQVAERITPDFKSLRPSWIGDLPISEDRVTTDNSPAVTTWNDRVYMLFVDGNNDDDELTLCSAPASDFRINDKKPVANWSEPVHAKLNGNNIRTGHSPAIIALNGTLYAFYVDKNNILQGITQPAGGTTWTSLNLYGHGQSSLKVGDAAPEICFFQGRIYIVYRQNSSDNNLCWSYYEVITGIWYDLGKLKDANGYNFESPNTPALEADAYHIYMAYQRKDGTDIKWAVGTPSSAAPEEYSNNISWQDKGKVESLGKDGTTNPDTKVGLALAYASGVFILVYVSTNGNLTQCALNDTGQNSTGSWIGSNTVKTNVNTHPSTARSKQAPALTIISGGGFLVYRGLDHDEIYWAYY